jgi:LytS/YehU family sensor histidine kinase
MIHTAPTIPSRLVGGFVVGALAQACRLILRMALIVGWSPHPTLATVWISALANGFGVALLLLIVSDAQVRAESERVQALVSQAQLVALRARMRPHFLFNTLNSIAELCRFAPERAEAAILRLSRLMRHALDASASTSMYLGEEIEVAQAYLAIEQERLGNRLSVVWQRDTACDRIAVPPFAVQTLVENAIQHGLARKKGPVMIRVTLRVGSRHTLVAVRDNGVGMPKAMRKRALAEENPALHGLQIVNQHLILLYGRGARLRLFSQEGVGTLVAFMLPEGTRSGSQRGGPSCPQP